MQNITLLSLHLAYLLSTSPLCTINNKYSKQISLITKSFFSRSLSHIIYASTPYHSTTINGNSFIKTLDTPLFFVSDGQNNYDFCPKGSKCCVSKYYNFTKGKIIENVNITESDFPGFDNKNSFFEYDCGDLKITKCNFIKCYTKGDNGGGIKIEQDCIVILHNCIFDRCHSKKNGGAGAIAKIIKFKHKIINNVLNDDPDHDMTKRLDIQYTCFQGCYTDDGNGYGTALLMGADSITFFYASTVECPPNDNSIPKGAQFDILANSISSQFINATGGKSTYCGAMEYRNAIKGFFRYQTIAKLQCKYAIAFTSVNISGLTITSCNIYKNNIKRKQGEDEKDNPPALVFVRTNDLLVENFYFVENQFNGVGKLAAKENEDNLKITLLNCYADTGNQNCWDQTYIKTESCDFGYKSITTFPLRQLNLGHCQGEIPPGQMIITSFFTASFVFSPSSPYSKSNVFSKSGYFTKSDKFTRSSQFTQSSHFTQSSDFTRSMTFTPSYHFNQSHFFTASKTFTSSNTFSSSEGFSKSQVFSKSADFTQSASFSGSKEFTSSKEFSPSEIFSASQKFTKSDEFSQSSKFTDSSVFTQSDVFSQSNIFTDSDCFTQSNIFSASVTFSHSSHFSASTEFSDSEIMHHVIIGDSDKDNKGLIIGAVAGSVGGAAVIGGLVAFFLFKKKTVPVGDITNMNETNASVTVDNQLQSIMDNDDPFADEFI